MSRSALVLVAVLLAAGCQPRYAVDVPAPPPRAEVRWQIVQVLGDDPGQERSALLGQPAGVRTDAQGRIYVGDRAAGAVKVYDASGQFLRQIGRRGRDPGELVDVTCFEVLANGEVVVADGQNQRLTRFDARGEVASTHAMDALAMLWPRDLRQLVSGDLVYAYKMPAVDRDGTRRPDATRLLHVFSADLDTKLAAFARVARLAPSGRMGDLLLQQAPGRLWIDGDGSILFAPGPYSGAIHRYRAVDGAWRHAGQLQGYIRDARPFVEATEEGLAVEGPTFDINSRRQRQTGFRRNESRGMFRLAGGELVHFTLVAEDGGRTFGVELYDAEDRLRAFGPLERVEMRPGEPTALPLHVEWKDADDRFYLRRHDDTGRGVIEIARLVEGAASP
ncbi:MAG: 6-bladed beta-propeller [Acidobacteriota bacterium]